MSKKESYTEALATLKERINNLITTNNSDHKEIIDSVKELVTHVNDENKLMDRRVTELEIEEIKGKTERKMIKIMVSVLAGSVSIIGTLLGILTYMGFI